MRYPMVMVEWNDACHVTHGWMDSPPEGAPQVFDHADDRCRTIGWVVRIDERSITLAQTDGISTVANTLQIPMSMVKSVALLRYPQ